MEINLELYKVFYVVGKELNFSAAARKLFISQSAVSQNISTLEKALGTKLFNRSTKKVSFTKEGDLLFSHIEPAINSILQGEASISETLNLERGKLHIGVSDTICKYYLIKYLQIFHEKFPLIEILITNRTSIECVELLKKNTVDLIITNLPNDELNDDLTVIETISFQDIIIAPIKFTQLKDTVVSFETLTHYPILLLGQKSSTTRFLQQIFISKNLILKPAIELGSIDLLVDMASIGLGITVIPDYVYDPSNKNLMIVTTDQPLNKRKLGIVTQAHIPISSAANAFIQCIL